MFPELIDNWHTKAVWLSAISTGRLYLQKIPPVLISVKRLRRHQDQREAESHDLPGCNAVPNQMRHSLVNITTMQNKTVILVLIFT
jgi:hypothetical protein